MHELFLHSKIKIFFLSSLKKEKTNNYCVQESAIFSWRYNFPNSDILLFGDKPNHSCSLKKLGVKHIPFPIEKGKKQKINYIFKNLPFYNEKNIYVYINSDIFIDSTAIKLFNKLEEIPYPWLASGRRTCLPEWKGRRISSNTEYQKKISAIQRMGKPGKPYSMDLFAFRGVKFDDMPDFYIGHCGWDNWLIYKCRTQKIPVIDFSNSVRIYHFDHFNSVTETGEKRYSRERKYENFNLKKIEDQSKLFHLGFSTHSFDGKKIIPKQKHLNLIREIQVLEHQSAFLRIFIRNLRKILFPIWKIGLQITMKREGW